MSRSSSSSHNVLSSTVAVLLLFSSCAGILFVKASDPDPLVDVSPLANETFVFRDVYTNGDTVITDGGTRAAINISLFPADINEGLTFVHFKLQPCGENEPHTHPRATELLTLISGGPIQAGLVDTKGVAHVYILYPGDIIIFPRALLHFELNVGTEEAFFVSALNSQFPGVLTAITGVLKLPTRTAAGALNQDFTTAQKLKDEALPYSSALVLPSKNAGCVPGRDITTDF